MHLRVRRPWLERRRTYIRSTGSFHGAAPWQVMRNGEDLLPVSSVPSTPIRESRAADDLLTPRSASTDDERHLSRSRDRLVRVVDEIALTLSSPQRNRSADCGSSKDHQHCRSSQRGSQDVTGFAFTEGRLGERCISARHDRFVTVLHRAERCSPGRAARHLGRRTGGCSRYGDQQPDDGYEDADDENA